jgi:hypothetical protein
MPYGKYISLQNSCKKTTEKVQYYAFGGLYKLTRNEKVFGRIFIERPAGTNADLKIFC